MTTPRYIVKRVGDGFELKRSDPQHQANMALLAAGGGLLAIYGLRRGGILGLTLGALGSTVAFEAAMGRNILELISRACQRRQPEGEAGPSFQHEDQTPAARQTPQDHVEEASMESFPASDAPARTASTSS